MNFRPILDNYTKIRLRDSGKALSNVAIRRKPDSKMTKLSVVNLWGSQGGKDKVMPVLLWSARA